MKKAGQAECRFCQPRLRLLARRIAQAHGGGLKIAAPRGFSAVIALPPRG